MQSQPTVSHADENPIAISDKGEWRLRPGIATVLKHYCQSTRLLVHVLVPWMYRRPALA